MMFLLLAGLGCSSPPPLDVTTASTPEASLQLGKEVEARAMAAGPGAAHSSLGELSGDWAVVVQAGEVTVGSGLASAERIHGGRFVLLKVSLDLDGSAVRSTGILGYDTASRMYQALWVSDLSTEMTLLAGRGSLEGAGLQLAGRGSEAEGVSRMQLLDEDTFVTESWGRSPDGEPVLLRRSRYTRLRP